MDRDRWVEAIKRASLPRNFSANGEDGVGSPIHPAVATQGAGSSSLQRSDSECSESSRASEASTQSTALMAEAAAARRPFNGKKYKLAEMQGYLQKKSPALMKGWQRRFFRIQPSGEMAYYKSEEEADQGLEPRGVVDLRDVLRDVGLQVSKCEITLRTSSKKATHLKASSLSEAQDWADCIAAWTEAIAKDQQA